MHSPRAAIVGLALLAAFPGTGCGKKEPPAPLHELDLELSGVEYQSLLSTHLTPTDRARASLDDILKAGERNLNWLNAVNKMITPQLTLYPPGSNKGIPIDSPSKYSEKTARDAYNKYLADVPAAQKAVILGQASIPTTPPADLQEYLKWTRVLDRIYQTAARWTLMEPNLIFLQSRKWQDVRGYYFLERTQDLETKLRDFANLPAADQAQLRPWLVNTCENSRSGTSTCEGRLKTAENLKDVWGFWTTYRTKSKGVWDGFFKIKAPRPDVKWTENVPGTGTVMSVPFKTPSAQDVQDFLAQNIEDEWKAQDFQLKLQFTSTAATYIQFLPNVTPNVNMVGGNVITMNALDSLTQWETQWTIRHEYGHTLGFTDCYIEFWDASEGAMVNYQLDITNLMCSRAGHLLASHVDELRAAHAP